MFSFSFFVITNSKHFLPSFYNSRGTNWNCAHVQLTYQDTQCAWTAQSLVPWIQITSAASGNGSATLILKVDPTTIARTGTVRIADSIFTVWQEVNPSAMPGFNPSRNFPAGKGPTTLVKGDFNNDGKIDVAVGNDDSKIAILLSDGKGNFGAPEFFNSWGAPTSLVAADINKDGILDLVTTIYARAENVVVLLGTGGGKFGNFTIFSAGALPNSIAVTDFNRDGKVDLVVSNGGSSGISLLLGKGDGTFNIAVDIGGFSSLPYPTQVIVADFNQDTKPDVAVSTAFGVNVLYGDGINGITAGPAYSSSSVPVAMDFNKDGREDLAVGTSVGGRGTVAVYLSNATGGFDAPLNSFLGSATDTEASVTSLTAGDLTIGRFQKYIF